MYKFTCSLPPKQSIMLNYLIDADDYIDARLPKDKGYFMCAKEGFIGNLLSSWSLYDMTTAIDGLVKSGYIKKKVVNIDMHNRTYIKLCKKAIQKLNRDYIKTILSKIENEEK